MRPEQVEEIITAYGAVLAKRSPLGLVRDIRQLPYPKAQIKEALKIALALTVNGDMRQQLKIGFISLADFQPLSNSEVDAIQTWNAGEIAIEIQTRIVEETHVLVQELAATGLWKPPRFCG